VVVATGDGAFGFNAIEVDTAVRHKAPVLIVVANNGAWQIEVHDQTVTTARCGRHKLRDADYAGMARAFGMHAERVGPRSARTHRAGARQPPGAARHDRHARVSTDGKTGLAWVPDLQPLAAWDEPNGSGEPLDADAILVA
jgi:acetolactate synthase-1/2/3 large subunit